MGVTIVACVNDEDQLDANLRMSPCLREPGPHQLLLYRDCASAAEGLNRGVSEAVNELVVLVHQDVYLPEGWPGQLVEQWRRAEGQGGAPIGIAGVIGMRSRQIPGSFVGHVVDRDHLTTFGPGPFPCDADLLDEMLLVVPRDTSGRFDESLGWHLYGVDRCLAEKARGNRVVVLDALSYHNSLSGEELGDAYRRSEAVLAHKWPELLPVYAPCSTIDTRSVAGVDAGAPGPTPGDV